MELIHERRLVRPDWQRVALAAIALTALFTTLDAGPLRDWPDTTAWWFAHVCGGLLILAAIDRWFFGEAARVSLLPAAATALAGAAAFAPAGLALDLAFPARDAAAAYRQINADGASLAFEFAALVPIYLLVWLPLHRIEPPEEAVPTTAQAPADVEEASGLLARLPPELGDELLWIRAQANYVEVRTERGRSLVLYSLARATEELGARGSCVHRSWWIAHDAVRRFRRTASGWTVEMRDGENIPVSRRRAGEMQARFGRDFRADHEGGATREA